MNSHKNARLGFTGRVQLVHRVLVDRWSAPRAAAAFGISVRTVWKWVGRFRREGCAGLRDRSSRPAHSPRRVRAGLERRIAQLRALPFSGPQIADRLALPLSTVGDVLRCLGLGRLSPLTLPPPIQRYERARPGELLHIDATRLGRFTAVGLARHPESPMDRLTRFTATATRESRDRQYRLCEEPFE